MVIGCAISSKKFDRIMKGPLSELLEKHNITAQLLDPDVPIQDQGTFSAVLHKQLGNAKFEALLREYHGMHPAVPIIDPIDRIAPLSSRDNMLAAVGADGIEVESSSGEKRRVHSPPQAVIKDLSSFEDVLEQMAQHGVEFPALVKPLSTIVEDKHDIYAVKNEEQLKQLSEGELCCKSGVVQHFIDHGEKLHKVYIIGDKVVEDVRLSLPDRADWRDNQIATGVTVDDPLSRVSAFDPSVQDSLNGEDDHLDPALRDSLATELRERLQLNLFNFDLIQHASGSMYIVDINYFPGLSKVPGYEHLFVEYLVEACS